MTDVEVSGVEQKLLNAEATFTQTELKEVVELLAPKLGFKRASDGSLSEKLIDPDAVFNQAEVYKSVELLAPQFGFSRGDMKPLTEEAIAKTTALTVPGYDHIGVLLVRERTIYDVQVGIPSLMDKILGNNIAPSMATYASVSRIALAQTVIVSPPNLVQSILDSTDNRNLRFFLDFDIEYGKWLKALADEIAKKNGGVTSGNALNSLFEIDTESSPQIQAGSP